MRKGNSWLLLFLVAISPILLVACGNQKAESLERATSENEVAPDFTLNDLKGNAISLNSFSNKNVVLLDFGATWCPYCVKSIPAMKGLHEKYKDEGLEIILIDIKESAQRVKVFAEKHEIPYTVLLDDTGSVASSYGVRGIPTIVVVGKDGTIRYKGHHIDEGVIEGILGD